MSTQKQLAAKQYLHYMSRMRQDTQIAVRISHTLLEMLDDIRREEKDIPGRAEMLRRLIEQQGNRLSKKEFSHGS
jgi:metal-responsive CopG/Arc/MetJ family transcriptional regulator